MGDEGQMSLTDEYYKHRKKRKNEEEENQQNNGLLYSSHFPDLAPVAISDDEDDGEDIAPVAQGERTWFQKPKAFEDGWQAGDVLKTITDTGNDLRAGLLSGVLGMGESIVDGILQVGALASSHLDDTFVNKTLGRSVKKFTQDFVAKDLYDERAIAEKIVKYTSVPDVWSIGDIANGEYDPTDDSILGARSDSLVESGGQLLATAGLQAVGVPWWLTTGATAFGGEAENAYKQGATFEEATGSAAISAGAEILTEKLFGGIKFGGKTLDDVLVKPFVDKISSKTVRTLVNLGIDTAGEGAEEVLSQVFSNLGSALYKEESIDELLLSEQAMDEYLESFIGGSVLGGGISGAKAVNSAVQGTDYKTGLTENETKVFEQELADRIKEAEEDGKKLTSKEKSAIYDAVMNDLQKGYISTEKIESILGGETYKTYQDTIANEDALKQEFDTLNKMKQGEMTGEQIDRRAELKQQLEEIKNNATRKQLQKQLSDETLKLLQGDRKGKGSLLFESYNENARKEQAFQADTSKYDAKQAEIVQKAVDSGVLNNTNRSHELVDMIAKIAAEKGVGFDFTNNAKLKESGFAVDGKQVNGYVTKDGITLNINSQKLLNSVVGHEISHVMEGTEIYTEMQKALFDYAKGKGDYQGRYDALTKLYEGVEGANVDAELTADLVGDYLFTDADFVSNLSTKHRNIFQKIYDEIKYLWKSATAGSKEARELEKVKRTFEKAYRESGKASADTKYSISDKNIKDVSTGYAYGESYYTMSYTQDGKVVGTLKYGEYDGKPNVKMIEVDPEYRRKGIGTKLLQELQKKYPDVEIDFGMATPDGMKLLDSVTYDVTDEAVVADRQKLKDLQAELNDLQGKLDGLFALIDNGKDLTEAQDAELHEFGDRWQETYETIRELEKSLQGKRATKTFVKTDTKYSLGFHAGDLGKAESYGEQGYYRDTGHFGTGTYFVGDEAKINDYTYGKRPHHAVEFNNYNLYKIRNNDDGYKLHKQLRAIDGGITEEFVEAAKADKFRVSELRHEAYNRTENYTVEEYNEDLGIDIANNYIDASIQAFTEVANENGVEIQDYDKWLSEQSDDVPSPGDFDYDYYKTDYLNYLQDAVEEVDKQKNDGYEKFRDAYFGLWLRFGKERVNRALQSVIEYDLTMKKSDYKTQMRSDSRATVFMKSLGYEGIDTRGTTLDNTEYGSVIYDLKGEDFAKKKEIGTAKYSLSDSDGKHLTKEQSEYFKDSKMRDENGNLKVMYHGSQDAGFHVFDPAHSDDEISLFFVDRNDVAASYSGTTETYEAKTIRTADDMNKFIESIGAEGYEVVEKDGKFTLLYEGDRVADSNTAAGIYEEFCWYEGVGEGDANYKVYLNLTNPLVVDAEGRNWNNISREYSQEIADRYNSLTAEEKDALTGLAEWGEYSVFKDEMLDARALAERGEAGVFDEAYTKNLARAYEKLGGANANLYDAFSIASDNFSAESIQEFAVKQMNTRDYAQKAKAEGYDGVIFKNIVDVGGYGNGSEGASTVAIAFDSNQIKSVANEKPGKNADIRYSLSEDSEGRKLSPAVQKRFGNSKVVDDNGSLKVVYHGTAAGEFSIFDKSKGSVEGDFGSGFYFTDNEYDVTNNYEGGGPDFDNKVSRRADTIYSEEEDITYEEAERRARAELFKGGHKFEVYLNIENPAIVGETILFDPDSYYSEYNQEDYENEDDYYGDVEQLIADEIDNIIWDIERNVDVNSTDGISDIVWEAFNEGGIDLEKLKKRLGKLYLEDSNGNSVENEVARQIVESLGYDGIIDPTVSNKWNMDMEAGTTHYIVFKPNQIKSVTNLNPTDNPDIRYSLSELGEKIKYYGNLRISGKDVAYAPVAEGVQKVPENVEAPIPETEAVQDVLPEDFAPVTEEPIPVGLHQAELDRLQAEMDVLVEEATKAYEAEDAETVTRLLQEMETLNQEWQELRRMEDDAEAINAERLDTLEEAPPEAEAPYYARESITLDEKSLAKLADKASELLFVEEADKAALAETIQSFAEDASLTKDDLFRAIQKDFGEIWMSDVEENTDYKEMRRLVKATRIYINDDHKGGFHSTRLDRHGHDGWDAFRKQHFGKFTLVNKNSAAGKHAMGVDSLYRELVELYPQYFPSDLNSEADQLQRIADVLDRPAREGIEGMMPLDEETLQEGVDAIYNGIMEYSNTERLRASQNAQREINSRFYDFAPVREDVAPTYDSTAKGTLEGQQTMFEERKTAKGKPNPNTAEVLDAEPEAVKRKNRAWAKFKTNFLDKGSVFEDLSLKEHNRELMGKWNYTLSSEARAQHLMGQGTNGVKSLNAIRDEVESTGKAKQFYEYVYHKHNIDRMSLAERYKDVENKPVFGDTVTADISREAVRKYEAENPVFKEYAEDVYTYMNHLRKLMVDNGVISQETADLWAEMYPYYVPIRRAGDAGLNIAVPLDTRRTGVNAPVKKAAGGSRDILPLFDTMAQRTEQTYKAIARNSFGVELKNTLGTTIETEATNLDETIDSIDAQDELLKKGENGRNPTFTVFENGEKVTFEITEDMYDALKPTSDGLLYTNKVANTITKAHRGLLTEYNPTFMLTNAIKDVQDVFLNSQHAARTYASLPKAFAELATKGHWYNEYMENGGEQNTYFDGKTNTFAQEKKGIAKWLGAISVANNFIERAPRLAEYIASREAGASVEVAMLDSARVTTNFAAGGDITKFLNRNGATFLNASVQGAMQQVRNVREAKANGLKGVMGLVAKTAAVGLSSILLNHLLWDDDEDYEELSDYVKQNYYVVAKYGDGQFVRIPKGRALAVIQEAFVQMENLVTGNDDVDLNSFLDLVINNLAPNNPVEDNILAPIIQVANNETWYGDDLVPTRLQDLPAAEQHDESTDSISKWLGEKLDFSPYKINYLLNQYSGGLGDLVLPMLTPEAESGDNSLVGNLLAPLKSKFTTDSAMNNQNVSDFYDTKDALAKSANSVNATDEDKLMYKYINSVNTELGELYKQKREIQNSDLSDAEKYAAVRDIQSQINALAKESLASYKDVYIDGEYAMVGDRHYRLTDSGTWQKISDDQLEQQEDVVNGLGIDPSEYWSNKTEYDFAYEYPEKYAVARSVGGFEKYKTYTSELYDISADKDENGKSIRGSRKEKVIDYINNLDADYGEKIILFKHEYNADDTYNYEIIEYLNGRNDISYEDMASILRELGFTVHDDGRITWD